MRRGGIRNTFVMQSHPGVYRLDWRPPPDGEKIAG